MTEYEFYHEMGLAHIAGIEWAFFDDEEGNKVLRGIRDGVAHHPITLVAALGREGQSCTTSVQEAGGLLGLSYDLVCKLCRGAAGEDMDTLRHMCGTAKMQTVNPRPM